MKYPILIVFLLLTKLYSYSQPTLWGTTSQGTTGVGTIFSIKTGSTNLETNYNFQVNNVGSPEQKLIQANNGKLYGLANMNSATTKGVLYEFEISTKKLSVIKIFGGADGEYPMGHLLLASNSKLYGVTKSGGLHNKGVIFEYNVSSGIFSVVHNFDGLGGDNNSSYAACSLSEASNGLIYGVTSTGGINNAGVLYEFNPVGNIFTKNYDFPISTINFPSGELTQANATKLYGIATNNTIIFEYDIPSKMCTAKQGFSTTVGTSPNPHLLLASNGMLYGVATNGGANNVGTIYRYDPNINVITKLYDFSTATSYTNGYSPIGGLMQASNGKLYGISYGSTNVYEFDISTNVYQNKCNILNGSVALGSLIQANDGKIYGVTSQGGSSGKGLLFSYDLTVGTCKTEVDFMGSLNGTFPQNGLVNYSQNIYYGTTNSGGQYSRGVLFKYDYSNNSYVKEHDFETQSGMSPSGKPVIASNGKIYGTTGAGGINSAGTIYEYDPITKVYTKKFDFNYSTSGTNPQGLIRASNNKLYGVTSAGGANTYGTLFEFDINTSVCTIKYHFSVSTGGSPVSTLVETSPGKFYGMASVGGTFGTVYGAVLFEFDNNLGIYTSKHNFQVPQYSHPNFSVVKSSNGKLYGLIQAMPSVATAYIYEFNPATNSYSKVYDFIAQLSGLNPMSNLMEASNNKLYGFASGGANYKGVLYEFDPNTYVYTMKLDYNVVNGSTPYGTLIEVCQTPPTPQKVNGLNNLCLGQTNLSLSVDTLIGATNYNWAFPAGVNVVTGAGTNSVVVDFSGLTAGNYTIGVSGSNSCGNGLQGVFNLTVGNPSLNISSSLGFNLCTGQSATLIANGAATYTWNTGSTTSSVIVTPTTSTSYTLTGQNIGGCSTTSVVNVSVSSTTPTVQINSSHTIICAGSSVTLTATGATTYTWSNSVNSQSIVVNPSIDMTYSVTGTNLNNCIGTSTLNLVVSKPPVISTSNSIICQGQPVTLTSTSANSYTWSTGSVNQTTVVNPTITTNYTLSATDNNGCIGNTQFTQPVYPLPNIITFNPFLCAKETTTLIVSGSLISYTWNTGAITNTLLITPTVTTTYYLIYSDTYGCNDTAYFQQPVSPCSSIDEIANSNLKIELWPNPFSGVFHIDYDLKTERCDIQILNSLGSVVFEKREVLPKEPINVDLTAGMYYLIIRDQNSRSYSLKLMKQ